jgi:hypothetical protein
MERKKARERLQKLRNTIGPDKVSSAIESGDLSQYSDFNLPQIVEEFGEGFVRKKMSHDPKILLYRTFDKGYAEDEVRDYFDTIHARIENLEKEGEIRDFSVVPYTSRISINQGRDTTSTTESRRLDQYNKWKKWAVHRGLDLEPYFRRKSRNDGNEFILLPDVFIVVNQNREVSGVFPCSDESAEYDIEWILDCIEEGEEWREREENGSELKIPDPGPHGSIKSHIKGNVSDVIGDRWKVFEEEKNVGTELNKEDIGRVDLVLKHDDGSRYALVEVKPSKNKAMIDKAIGQVYRYKYQFQNRLNMDNMEIELYVAAPEFHDSHLSAMSEIEITPLKIPTGTY